MRQVRLDTPDGSTLVALPPPGDFDSFYVFALHKSGSTLMNNMLAILFQVLGIPQMAISEWAFAAGLPENKILNPEEVIFERGYCYRGYRSFPEYLNGFDLSKNKKILLIRDPRDMVVSNFFSYAQSHGIPETGVIRDELLTKRQEVLDTKIDDFCLNDAATFITEYIDYEKIMDQNLKIYRYEDVIFKKKAWVIDMFNYFGISADSALIAQVAKENDIIPQTERPDRHIRQVFPGNYKKHLKNETIESLNDVFSKILEKYKYNLD